MVSLTQPKTQEALDKNLTQPGTIIPFILFFGGVGSLATFLNQFGQTAKLKPILKQSIF